MARTTAEERAAAKDAGNNDKLQLNVPVTPELLAQVDELRWVKRIEGRAATARMLIEAGIKAVSS